MTTSQPVRPGPTRRIVAFLVLALLACVLVIDLSASDPLNPYQAPPFLALGSGLAASGAHCAAPATD